MSESQTALIFNLKFANINFPRVRKRAFSSTHFLSKNMDFGNSLRMTEQEDISSSYFTIEETWGR